MNAACTYVGERWRCRLDVIHFVHVNYTQSIYLKSISCVNVSVWNPFDSATDHRLGQTTGDRFDNQFVSG